MANKGYIKRETCPSNRRMIDILISREGIKLLAEIAPSAKTFVESFFTNKITEDEAKELYRILEKIKI